MLKQVDQFVNQWCEGLLRPLRFSERNRQIAKLEGSDSIVWPERKSKRVYLLVPDHLVLNSPISASLRQVATHDLVKQLLPFQNDEVFAASDSDTLLAVLKSDITPLLSQAQTHESGEKLSGVVFSHDNSYHFVDTTAANQTTSATPKVVVALLAGLLLFFAGHFWVHNKNKQRIDSLKQTISQLENSNKDFENVDIHLSGAALDTVLAALDKTNGLLELNSKVDQISLRSVSNGLELVMDASSPNAIDQLTNFSNDENFQDVDFVSAISQNTADSNERYRLIATFAPDVAEAPNYKEVKLGARQHED